MVGDVEVLTYKINLKRQYMHKNRTKYGWYKFRRKINKWIRIATKIANVVIHPEIKNMNITTRHTKKLGKINSDVANQIIRKYQKNKKCKKISNVSLIVPAKYSSKYPNVVYDEDKKQLNIKPLRMLLTWKAPREFLKINQIEVNNKYAYVSISVQSGTPKKYTDMVGVDLNIKHNMASIGNPRTHVVDFLGKGYIYKRLKYKKIRERFQKQKRLNKIKEMGNKEQRLTNDINHKLSCKILELASQQHANISLENLLNIRTTKCYNKKFRYFLNSWPFYTLRSFVEYKSKLKGITAVAVDPKYTSQICSSCKKVNKCSSKKYKCASCGLRIHRDENAAYNIANRGQQSLQN